MATEPQAEGPISDEQFADSLLQSIEPEVEEEADEETQEIETDDAESEVEDDAPDDVGGDEDTDEADDDADDTEEDDDESADDDNSKGEPLFTVKVNGEERKVTEQELKNDYSGRSALQQRHEELKSQEQQFQQVAQTLQQERQALMQLYEQAQSAGFKPAPTKPDPAMMQTDPIGYFEAKATYDQAMEEHQQTQAQIRYHQQQQQQFEQQQRQKVLAEQRERLLEAMPELKDPEQGKKVQAALLDTAKAYGFSSEEVDQVTDARTVQMLNDARKWRELQAGKKAAKKPHEDATAVTRPKAKMRDGGKAVMAKKQLQSAKRTQKDDDWVNVLLNP